jgi:hypothetical protein
VPFKTIRPGRAFYSTKFINDSSKIMSLIRILPESLASDSRFSKEYPITSLFYADGLKLIHFPYKYYFYGFKS